jgi:hypothetical protein
VSACTILRFSQVDPAAKDFHPRSIAILKVDVGPNEEAKGVSEKAVAEVLTDKRWYSNVIDNQNLENKIRENEELSNAVNEYLSKLKTVNYSDPYLSRKIGELIGAEALLMVSVDIWNYTMEQDKKVAKVSLGMRLYEASTGHLMWSAGHHRAESYMLLKPELASVARKVANDMFSRMPR